LCFGIIFKIHLLECIINLVDPQFDAVQGINCRLSVLLSLEGFSFLVTHSVSQKVLRLSSYRLSHSEVQPSDPGVWMTHGQDYFAQLRKLDYTRIAWQRVDIAVASPKISIAPHLFMEQGNELDIISAAYPVSANEKVLVEPVFDLGPVAATLVPDYIAENCSSIFPGSTLRNASAVFVKGVLRRHSQLISRQVFVNIHSGFIEITVIQGLRLLYLNAFKYASPSDVLYYVIFVLEQLGFVPSEEKITLLGDISANSTLFLQLKMYCGSLNFINDPDELMFGEVFAGMPKHNYFTLLNIPICE